MPPPAAPRRSLPRRDSPHAVARWCAANGWPVHPLAPGRKTPVGNCPSCRSSGHPPEACPCREMRRWCHGFHAATLDPALIDEWWGQEPALGVGVSCGPAGLLVIDVDAHHGRPPERSRLLPGIAIDSRVNLDGLASGFDTLALLAAYRKQANPATDSTTLRVRTPSGGLHIWYRVPDGSPPYRSSVGSSPRVALAWQVDVRAQGGYVVAPATTTSSGEYEAVGVARMPAVLPEWLRDELARTGHVVTRNPAPEPQPKLPSTRRAVSSSRVLTALLAEISACGFVPEGAGFSEKLNRAAYTAGGLTAAGHISENEATRLLREAADLARPAQRVRNERIIADGIAAGRRAPFHVKRG